MNENKALTAKKSRFAPYAVFDKCRICNSKIHQKGSVYCQGMNHMMHDGPRTNCESANQTAHTKRGSVPCVARNCWPPHSTSRAMSESGGTAGLQDEEHIHLTFNPPLYTQSYSFAFDKLFKCNPPVAKMADFGCAEGKFIEHLKQLPFLQELSAVDVDQLALDECRFRAEPRAWNFLFPRFVPLIVRLMRGSVLVPDPTFCGLDAITCVELIEHLPIESVKAFPATVFGYFNPRVVIITTPNCEFNVLFPQLRGGKLRHWDHRFEWNRRQFEDWCNAAADSYGYSVSFTGVGDPPDEFRHVGHCSQIAVFERLSSQPTLSAKEEQVTCKLIESYKYPAREKDAVAEQPLEPFDWSFLQNED